MIAPSLVASAISREALARFRYSIPNHRSMSVPRASAFDRRGVCVPKFELLQDVLDVRREAVEIRFEICPWLLVAGRALRSRRVNFEVLYGQRQ